MKITLSVTDGPDAGLEYAFDQHDTFIVGRAGYSHFHLPRKDQCFSRTHFMVEVSPTLCRLMEMASTNGTFVNRRRVTEIDLKHGDVIEGGDTIIRVRIEGDGAETATRKPGNVAPDHAPRQTLAEPAPRTTLAESLPPPTARVTLAEPPRPPVKEDSARQTLVEPPPPHRRTDAAKPQAAISDPPLPARIADFRVLAEIGRGGMGVVYKAEDARTGAPVALKCIRPLEQVSQRDFARFSREAAILKNLRHPNIVRFFDQGSCDGQLYFAREFVDGQNTEQLLTQHGVLPTCRGDCLPVARRARLRAREPVRAP